ncbi:MAG: acetyl-CoA carboxylase biotin carboxyl carrier protein subunit, partial [Bacteroidales bacterium]|nr:acetyl-CoA carboxylase biotin carboxyl carrier protein subunit [Bacteroidales bacterium]
MALEVRIGKRLAKVQLLNREGDLMKFEVDGRIYDLD